ncbi:MAG: TrkH family potassium uptake protein [Erysipelotrichaceae bacterium]|nr:TrkH family potassium uptake protein [Erysipelotrichaceae bacterium]
MDQIEKNFPGLRIVFYYAGWIVIGISLLMIIPLFTSLVVNEINPVLDFLISLAISLSVGLMMVMLGTGHNADRVNLQWKHGFVIAALSWVILVILCAIPYRLSGHNDSFLNACFDVMSGFTTTGLVLTQDLDHISIGLNMWRHILTFVGGQGMVVLALSFLVNQMSGAYKIYVGEAKDIGLVPNVKGTARLIWKISLVYLIIGTLALWIDGMIIGLNPLSAFFNGLFMFSSAWSTGGFAPYSQNIMYYHSFSFEIITMIFLILGSLNFGLHYAVWQGKKKEIIKNIEIQSFVITSFVCCALAIVALAHLYPDSVAVFRRIVYNIISAHTTTGFSNIYARQFALQWGDFGNIIIITAMLIGGSACSTAGGFKGLRVGIVFKSIIADVKKLLSSERSVKVYKYHHIKDYILDDNIVKSSSIIIICYFITFAIGTALGTYYGYPMTESAFEAASVTGNVGLSIGITTATMPVLMRLYYIVAMFMGRLEFLSVFALFGYIVGGLKKLCAKYVKH